MPTWIIQAPTGPQSGAQVVALIQNLTNWFFAVFLIVAVVFIVLAAWQFISSRAEPAGVAQARSKLFWAASAIVAAVVSRGIAAAIQKIVVG